LTVLIFLPLLHLTSKISNISFDYPLDRLACYLAWSHIIVLCSPNRTNLSLISRRITRPSSSDCRDTFLLFSQIFGSWTQTLSEMHDCLSRI